VWFLKNERNAFIDPPPGVYKIIKHVKAQIKQQHSDQKRKKGKKGAIGAKKNSGFEFKIPKINEKPKKKKEGFFKKTKEEIEEELTKEQYKNLKLKNKK
jgi:hypothetical protein